LDKSSLNRSNNAGTKRMSVQQRGLMRASTKKFDNMINIVNKDVVEEKKENLINKKLEKFLDSNYIIIFMTVCTLFALFANDIAAAACPPSVDDAINGVQCFLFAIFSLEIILCSIAKKEYLFSFFFWLDIISTLSLLQDISWISDKMMGETDFE
jgi:hypothetical protein